MDWDIEKLADEEMMHRAILEAFEVDPEDVDTKDCVLQAVLADESACIARASERLSQALTERYKRLKFWFDVAEAIDDEPLLDHVVGAK